MFINYLKSTFTVGIVMVLLAPAVVGYALQIRLNLASEFALSIYGIYSLCYLIFQIVCAELNNRKIKKDVDARGENWNELGVGIVIVGYREQKDLFRRCLESIKNSNYKNIKRVVVVIDGNDQDDVYMAEVYRGVFGDNIVNVDFLVGHKGDDCDHSMFGENENICILQPHGGKREGLYTGFKLLLQDPEVKVILTTDSDTILDTNAVKELAYSCRHEEVGAVAGQILIWNKSDSLLSNIVSYRYWYSFNLERACESFWKTVLCVAGPMACYKSEVVKDILDTWFNQKFFGEKCTFGDDRHLTNRVLQQGKKVIYTPYAIGYTDTPAEFGRYFRQQTRWGKSYFREFLFNMQSVYMHPIWMCFELCYHIVYFFLLMYWFVYVMYFGSIYQQSLAVLFTLGMSIIKSVYGCIKTKDASFLFFYLYSFVYFFMIIPSKIIALVTVWNTKWGTRGKSLSWVESYWGIVLWYGTVAGGIGWTVSKNLDFDFTDLKYKIAFVGLVAWIGLVVITVVVEMILRRMRVLMTSLEKEIRSNSNVLSV